MTAGKLKTHFTNAENYLKGLALFKNTRIEKVLLVDYPVSQLEDLLAPEIKTIIVEEWLHELLQIMKNRVDNERIGKEDHPMTRILITLIEAGLIEEEAFKMSHDQFVAWVNGGKKNLTPNTTQKVVPPN